MAHIGLICPNSPGHLNPMCALGYELKQREHHVTLIGVLDAEPYAKSAGLNFRAIGIDEFPVGSSTKLVERLSRLKGITAVRETIALLAKGSQIVLEDTPAIARSEGMDLLLVDQASPSGGTVAEHLDIPFVSVCNALMLNREWNVPPFTTTWMYRSTWWAKLRNIVGHLALEQIAQPLSAVSNEYRTQWGLPKLTDPNQVFSSLAQISQQVEALEFPRQSLPPNFHFVGPFSSPSSREPIPFPWEKLDGRPLVYASMGTLQNQLTYIFEAIAQACEPLDVQLVITLGRSGAGLDELSLSGNPILVDYVPQLEVLQKASLTLTHAGMNTTLESLRQGVPLVAIPITNDQPGVAARLKWAGAGEVVPLNQVSGDRLRQAIQTVLNTPSYHESAKKIQRDIQKAGGASKAADIVEQVIRTGEPVLQHLN